MAVAQNGPFSAPTVFSQASENSQTAQEFIDSQLSLEAEAREVLPYQFDTCTRPLGPLRQSLFSCLTCNPPPSSPTEPYKAAGICYSCSISCHGEHNLVELFSKRNFVCDCGTTRIPSTSPCTLRVGEETGIKGTVHSETPADTNRYNHNFRNSFCGCDEGYDANKERGTMFQCLGLGTTEAGCCGEDWWHPECIVGLPRDWYKKASEAMKAASGDVKVEGQGATEGQIPATDVNGHNGQATEAAATVDDDELSPPGFPHEDDFEYFLCYKCVGAFPWIKRYAGAAGFLEPVFLKSESNVLHPSQTIVEQPGLSAADKSIASENNMAESKKRKASPEADNESVDQPLKRQRSSDSPTSTTAKSECKYRGLPPAPNGTFSLFLKEDFRNYICRCSSCFSNVSKHPYLMEEEEAYEPPLSSEGGDDAPGSIGSRSLLDRGEAALNNVDRVRAIEGVMVYNHLKDKVKDFLKPFAESGQPVGAEDIKKYFESLRGDADAIKTAAAKSNADGGDGDNRKGTERLLAPILGRLGYLTVAT